MSAGLRRCKAWPDIWLVEAPMVKPTLMPETVNGWRWPRKYSTPSPPPTPTMKPPLVKTTRTVPLSARDGEAAPKANNASKATARTRTICFLIDALQGLLIWCRTGFVEFDYNPCDVGGHFKTTLCS